MVPEKAEILVMMSLIQINPDHLRQVPFADHLNIIAAMIGELHTPMEF
jgi:hypothetical protein